jgi:aspartate kinase
MPLSDAGSAAEMSLIVQKYGGSSVGDAERIRNVARRVARRHLQGDRLVVVVSAMGDTTDELIALAREMSDAPSEREMDVLLSTGEIVSSTLLAMALRQIGVDALSFTGAQAGIYTDSVYGKARILKIDPSRVEEALARQQVAIVAGFQGLTAETDVATLGRGGSDTTAVALAAALEAAQCEIYTDVEGVYTCDPRIEPRARKLTDIGYEEMLELASQGARVMHARAVELGAIYHVPILVASSFADVPGTLIHEGQTVEPTNKVRGISHELGIAKITVRGLADQPGIAARLFEPLSTAHVVVDTIVQNASVDKLTDVTFTVKADDLPKAVQHIHPAAEAIGASTVVTDDRVGKVSIVGTGVANTPGYASRMFRALTDANINIQLITTSEIRITCILAADDVPRAVRALHAAFQLEEG